jgi:class 3 adenylate cyclase
MGVRTDGGEEVVIGPNQVFDLPPGHLTWVEGDEELVMLDWAGGAGFDVRAGEVARVMATILFTDMVGSTELAGKVGDAGLETDGGHARRCRPHRPRSLRRP